MNIETLKTLISNTNEKFVLITGNNEKALLMGLKELGLDPIDHNRKNQLIERHGGFDMAIYYNPDDRFISASRQLSQIFPSIGERKGSVLFLSEGSFAQGFYQDYAFPAKTLFVADIIAHFELSNGHLTTFGFDRSERKSSLAKLSGENE